MSFKVTARMILELGAELIGSDGVAFYELIKNAFDAGSEHVEVDVVNRVPIQTCNEILAACDKGEATGGPAKTSRAFKACQKVAIESVPESAIQHEVAVQSLKKAKSWNALRKAVDDLNFIQFVDYGSGMSEDDLNNIYLVLGTRNRLKQKEGGPNARPVLGEKGIGRLSAMRMGDRLSIRTTKGHEPTWNKLDINWRVFSHDSDAMLSDIEIRPQSGAEKEDVTEKGTRILISGLKRTWTQEAVVNIADEEISRFMDPFLDDTVFPISIRYNDDPVTIPRFDKDLFDHAHAAVACTFEASKTKSRLSGHIDYRLRTREKSFALGGEHLASVTETDLSQLHHVGSFTAKFYWFNRRILTAIEGIGDRKRVLMLVNDWSGGLMVFRDGFRVLPYGNPDDDWLSLDKKALASQGYKVNRKQLIGKVEISSKGNPTLTDQTNREGLRDCPSKVVLTRLLRHVLEAEFRAFMNEVDKELKAQVDLTFDDIQERISDAAKRMRASVKLLVRSHPEVKADHALVTDLQESSEKIETLIRETETVAESFEQGRSEMVYLAGIGAMVEFVAHELNRATTRTLDLLSSRNLRTVPNLGPLRSQIKTLQKRLRILDPLSRPGRQVKESFELVGWIQEILEAHEAQFERHQITYSVEALPPEGHLKVKMVKGMLVQILENLISNSVYWLKQRSKLRKRFRPSISVHIDTDSKQIWFSDNGPGIPPDRLDSVFQAFVTTKPPGHGKGLGLFIAKEVAEYHEAQLYISEDTNEEGNFNTFVFDFS